ncbi:hypothetical protein JVU11DRAFT_57 [Chiua virens]|nr:hypothetical protein JVU11DRAFT_57 [Chiua virens]
MATVYIRHQDGKSKYLIPAVDPWQNSRQAVNLTTYTPPSTNLRAAFQDLTNVPRDLPTEEALRLEIEKLGAATLDIDQTFYEIGGRLSDVSKQQNKRVDLYDTCCALEAQWKEHHRTYQRLLWRSRELAGKAQATVDEFREIVLPLLRGEDTRDEKEVIIQEQLRALERESEPSQQISQDFLDFSDTLDKYIKEFSRTVEGLEIGLQSQKVADLKERLFSARSVMEVVSRDVKELGWKFASDIAVVGITLLLAYVIPSLHERFAGISEVTAAAAAVTINYTNVKHSGLKFFEAWGRYHITVARYNDVKTEYDIENACLGQMEKLDATLQDAMPLVQEVTARLGIFATVWAAIRADIQQVQNWLGRAADPSSRVFIQRVQKLEQLYGYLSQALRLYQVKVKPNTTRQEQK